MFDYWFMGKPSLMSMSNFFSFDSSYQYEPVMRPLDQKVIDREMDASR